MTAGKASVQRVLIMGAAGRDFHDFNTRFRDDPQTRVVAFTAAQIPDIAGRRYPAALSGPLYPDGLPIHDEEDLEALIRDEAIDQVCFSYSDLSHTEVMHRASRVLAAGASFTFLGPQVTALPSSLPVIAVCAVRTGVGKSAFSRAVVAKLREQGIRVAAIRHPMPYGDLTRQAVQRFASEADLDAAEATIEEREEYEPYLAMGATIHAGVDYAAILAEAEREADVILWDGGNNDLPFYRSDLHFVLLDACRPGHEITYHPGEANFRRADVLVINKVDAAAEEDVEAIRSRAESLRPGVPILLGEMPQQVDDPAAIEGARVVIVGDGPTLTHGGMATGAGTLAARRFGAAEIVEARPYAVGELAEAFARFPHLGPEVPALGYSERQVQDLEATLSRTPADLILDATPARLANRIRLDKPVVRVEYAFAERGTSLDALLGDFVDRHVDRRSG